jgi:hypothetical protein
MTIEKGSYYEKIIIHFLRIKGSQIFIINNSPIGPRDNFLRMIIMHAVLSVRQRFLDMDVSKAASVTGGTRDQGKTPYPVPSRQTAMRFS